MKAVFSDLDGSLRDSVCGIPVDNLEALFELGRLGIQRVVATGRSLYAARKVLSSDFPIDYLIFSSGAGVFDWKNQRLMVSHHLNSEEVEAILDCLQAAQLDFMLHHPVPDNHYFAYQRYSQHNLDFEHRLRLYAEFAQPLNWAEAHRPCSECIAIVPEAQILESYQHLALVLPHLSIIRATSPLDRRSGWVEIFPAHVSKSQAAARLCAELGIGKQMAFGNDYNDSDLLSWAQQAYVVADAPLDLRKHYSQVAVAAQAGFAEAVGLWLDSL